MPQQKTIYQEIYEQHKLLDIVKFFSLKKKKTQSWTDGKGGDSWGNWGGGGMYVIKKH